MAGLKSWAPATLRAPARTRSAKAALTLCFLIAAVVAPPHLPPFLLTVVMLSFVYAILAMSLDVLMGYTGMESLGQAAFFGIGAYTIGIVTTRHGAASWPIAVLLALMFGTLSAAIAGLMAVRLGGLFFLVMTLAFAQVLWGVSESWDTLTGGYLGITGIPAAVSRFGFRRQLLLRRPGCLASRRVLMVRSCRVAVWPQLARHYDDSESRMKTSGFNVWLHRYIAFVICGLFATVGRSLVRIRYPVRVA